MKNIILFIGSVLILGGCSVVKDKLGLEDEKPIEQPPIVEQPEVPQEPIDPRQCTSIEDMGDGHEGRLWKPHSERTGAVVILMQERYHAASFDLFDRENQIIANVPGNGKNGINVLDRHWGIHNGGRDHIYLTQTASGLESHKPLTLRYSLGAFRDCFTVSEPSWRWD